MKIVGLMPIRNESWCLGLTLRAALMWCDEVIPLLHACTDESRSICHQVMMESKDQIQCVFSIDDPRWDEMSHRQLMLQQARIGSATHIAIVDADEILSGNLLGSIRDIISVMCERFVLSFPAGSPYTPILRAPGYNLRGSIDRFHENGVWGQRTFSLAFPDDPALYWAGDKFHSREPEGRPPMPWMPLTQQDGGIMHLWGASERRLRAKHAAYKVTERLRWPDRTVGGIESQYRLATGGDPTGQVLGRIETPDMWTYKQVPASWWDPYRDLLQHLHLDAEPWQEEYVRQMVRDYGPETFSGLDLLGIA